MNNDYNLNSDFYKDLDTNFEQAYKMSENNYTHDELIDLLKFGNIPQKQIAALKFDTINNESDAKVLLDNLTGCDGKIREAIALTVNKFITNNSHTRTYFEKIGYKTFADATIDINANICRLVVDSAILLKSDYNFSKKYTGIIVNYTIEALDELSKFIFRDKKYIINKQLFKLYWCLEALKYFWEYVPDDVLEDILKKSANQSEYTIREKCAQIIVNSGKFRELQKILENDENYYVREVINHVL